MMILREGMNMDVDEERGSREAVPISILPGRAYRDLI